MLLMRAIVLLLLALTGCYDRSAAREIVTKHGKWELVRVQRSQHGGQPQYAYELLFQNRPVKVAGSLTTPVGTFTNSAPTDRFSDSGWIQCASCRVAERDATPPLTSDELARGYYHTTGKYRRIGTPPDWVFQWFDPNHGTWMNPEYLYDSLVGREVPPTVTTPHSSGQ